MMRETEKSRFPFTAIQWQELEHQALIFKYMVSGMPIPPDLLFSIKSNMDLSLSPQHYGWNILQMGLGRKIDLEPGRCRRTDGKKWRCSKEAYIDSKYCERHMHRGKNRSRKHVENNITPSTEYKNPSNMFQSNNPPFQYSHHSSSRSNNGFGLSFQDDDNSNRYGHGVKEEAGEHSFFSEASRTMRRFSESSSSSSLTLNNSTTSSKHSDYSSSSTYLGLQSFTDTQNQHKLHQNSCLLGNDDEPQKTVHRFFDEWPRNLDDDDDSAKYCSSLSNTQLSISVPSSSQVFPVFNSRTW